MIISALIGKLFLLFLRVNGSGTFPPPLSAEDERECFVKAKAGENKSREKLILHNLRLVAHIVKKYYSSYKEQDDLISIGTVGLIKAIDSFKADKGARFATYAGKCIQNEILMFFRSQKKLNNETSIHESVDTDKDGNPLTYIDVIPCEDNILENAYHGIKISVMIDALNGALEPREKEIIIRRYGLNGSGKEMPQREVAAELGISRSYVSRIEKTALEKMKKYMCEMGIDEE